MRVIATRAPLKTTEGHSAKRARPTARPPHTHTLHTRARELQPHPHRWRQLPRRTATIFSRALYITTNYHLHPYHKQQHFLFPISIIHAHLLNLRHVRFYYSYYYFYICDWTSEFRVIENLLFVFIEGKTILEGFDICDDVTETKMAPTKGIYSGVETDLFWCD